MKLAEVPVRDLLLRVALAVQVSSLAVLLLACGAGPAAPQAFDAAVPTTPGAVPTYARPTVPPDRRDAAPPQAVPVTVAPNPSQAVQIPAPSTNDFSRLPPVTSENPNLVVASTQYSGDQKNLIVSTVNVDPVNPTSGRLDVAGWGSFDATVQPDPSQLVYVDIPNGYDTSYLPTVSTDSPNLMLFSVTYAYPGGVPELAVTVGDPFFDAPTNGSLLIDW